MRSRATKACAMSAPNPPLFRLATADEVRARIAARAATSEEYEYILAALLKIEAERAAR
jgi:hypothetical protein